jgi:hypothetical protein
MTCAIAPSKIAWLLTNKTMTQQASYWVITSTPRLLFLFRLVSRGIIAIEHSVFPHKALNSPFSINHFLCPCIEGMVARPNINVDFWFG